MNSHFVNAAAADSTTTCDVTPYNSTRASYFQSTKGKGGDFLAPSSLATADWPEADPLDVPQPIRVATETERTTLRQAALNLDFSLARFSSNHRDAALADFIYMLLTSAAFQFNPKNHIDQAAIWKQRVAACVRRGKPVQIVYPLMCKIPNFAKQMTSAASATGGEEVALIHFQHIADTVKIVYSPGIKIILLIDAAFYNPAIHNDEVAVKRYIQDLQRLRQEVGAEDIELYDYAELIAAESARDFHAAYRHASIELPESAETDPAHGTWLESMRSTVNTICYPLTYSDMRDLFSSKKNPANKWYGLVERLASEGLRQMIALKAAANEVNVPEKIWPGHLRVSCHKKRVIGSFAIPGLRVYPRYYTSSRILPYHGVPLIRPANNGPALDIFPEISLRGRIDLTRVILPNGDTYFYELVTPHLHPL